MAFGIPFLGKKKRKEQGEIKYDPNEIFLALDIGTRYIKTVLFKVNSSSEITIIGYARFAQKYGAMRDAMIVNLQNVIEACDLCVGKAIEMAEKRLGQVKLPTKAVVGIAGELVRGIAIIANYDREQPNQPIDRDELASVVEQIKNNAFAGAISEISEEIGVPVEQIEEISTRINTTEIDRVLVNNPLDFTGKKVNYRVFSTFAPKLHVNSLYELAGKLGLEECNVVVQPYAIARAMKESQQQNAGAVVIDMGGGTTDIAVVNNGGVVGTKMFAFGGEVLTKRIAEAFKLDMPKAEALKLDYTDQSVTEAQAKEIKAIVNQDLLIWAEGVQVALEEILEDENGDLEKLPSQIYLCGGGVALPEVREVLLSHPWLTVLPFTKFPKISYLFPNQLVGVNDETRLLIDPSDVTPAAIARMLIDVG